MVENLVPDQRISLTVGQIVIACQELEQLLRILGAFIGEGDWADKNKKHQKLRKDSLGQNFDHLMSHAQGNVEEFSKHAKQIVDKRNKLVHHYADTFSDELATGDHEAIIIRLESQLHEIQELLLSFRATRDVLVANLKELGMIER